MKNHNPNKAYEDQQSSGSENLNKTLVKLNIIISLFKRDIKNIILYFLLLIPLTALILLQQSKDSTSIVLFAITLISAAYVVMFEFKYLKKQHTFTISNLANYLEECKSTLILWYRNSRTHLIIPSIIAFNCLFFLAIGLSEPTASIMSLDIVLALFFSLIFAIFLNYWIKIKASQYTTLYELIDISDEKFDSLFKRYRRSTTIIFFILGIIGLLLLSLTVMMLI